MPEAVSAQFDAAMPAGDDDNQVVLPRPFEHPRNGHACTAFAVIVFDQRAVRQHHSPAVVGGFGEFFALFEDDPKGFGLFFRANPPT